MAEPIGSSRPLNEAVADYYRRVDAGDDVDKFAFIAAHAEIAAELVEFFRNERSVARAINDGETADFEMPPIARSGSNGSRGLQIRCPHCSNQVELLVDTPFEEISCHSCGSMFNLVHREDATREATTLKRVGRFELVARLGIGGFGSVWKARDSELDRIVAIKIPRKGQLGPNEIEQFFREARAAAQLRHPNIVPVHEVGRDGDTIFIVCDLVRGVELSDWLTSNRPGIREAVGLARKVALALHHAHQCGVIHRDLKPSNIMMDVNCEPHLMDFGLAKREIGEITMTVDGQILGTPAYMSPEQAAGRSHWTDRRTDIYSLGVVLYRLLTGELPFRGNAQMQVFQRLTDDPPSPRKLNRHLPFDLETICLKCLEREPNRRYSTALELAQEFDRFLAGEPIVSRPLSRTERAVRWMRRKPALATALGLLLVLAIAGPVTAMRIESQRRQLDGLLAERNTMIDRMADDKRRDETKIASLSRELATWHGRENPWTLWPPRAAGPPRLTLLRELDAARSVQIDKQLADGGIEPWEAALGRMALAQLAESANRRADALRQWREAESSLRMVISDNRPAAAAKYALAQTCMAIAGQLEPTDGAAAVQYLQEAGGLFASLAGQGRADAPSSQVYRFEAEMRAAAAAGFDAAESHLNVATGLKNQIVDWPDGPVELYQMVSALQGEKALAENPSDLSANEQTD
jgi:serine/threonine protein kinase